MLGTSLRELVYEDGRVVGLLASRPGQGTIEIRARLVVGADGRYSRTARAANLPVEEHPNNRFAYFAYYRNVALALTPGSQLWYPLPMGYGNKGQMQQIGYSTAFRTTGRKTSYGQSIIP